MLLHEKTKTGKIKNNDSVQREASPIFVHQSKLSFTLQASQQEWELDIHYFRTMYAQLLSLATKGNLKNSDRKNQLKQQLYFMECMIEEDTQSLIDRFKALAYDFKTSPAPKMGTIFQEYADLEEEFQLLRNDFRRLSVDLLKEINRICPVKIY